MVTDSLPVCSNLKANNRVSWFSVELLSERLSGCYSRRQQRISFFRDKNWPFFNLKLHHYSVEWSSRALCLYKHKGLVINLGYLTNFKTALIQFLYRFNIYML